MKLLEIKDYLHAQLIGEWDDFWISEVKMDSREIKTGDLFLAYGKGSDYINEAISLGAKAIITEKEIPLQVVPVLKVESVLESLTLLAMWNRNQFNGKVVAITGSNGKTSTKELLKFLLSFDKMVLANFESENNHLGVPKTLLKLNNEYDFVILEMGMNHLGEIGHLSKIARPDIGIITNIGTAHIGYLGSQDAIFKAKMELVQETPEIILFVNGLDKYLKTVKANPVYLEYPSVGSIPAINVSLACKVCEYLGYTKEEIKRRLGLFPGVKSRMQVLERDDKIIIDDAYNASYESFSYGLEFLKKYSGRKVIILGDILELGDYSQEIHQKAYDLASQYPHSFLITVGKEISFIPHTPHFYSLKDLKEFLKTFPFEKDDVIYLKASHKVGLSALVDYLKTIL